MSDAKQRWDDVGERFSSLGRRFKERLDEERSSEAQDDEELKDALRRLGDAVDDVLTSVGRTVRDPKVQDDMRSAGRSLGDALAATFDDVGRELRRVGDDLRGKLTNREAPEAEDEGPPSTTHP